MDIVERVIIMECAYGRMGIPGVRYSLLFVYAQPVT
jgi:hypothetical protein